MSLSETPRTDAHGNTWTINPESCPQCARLRSQLAETNTENEVLREQNFAMNKTIAANRAEIERLKAFLADERAERERQQCRASSAEAEREVQRAAREKAETELAVERVAPLSNELATYRDLKGPQ